MSYDRWISDSVQVVEAVGAGILVVGGLTVFAQYAGDVIAGRDASYRRLRRNLGRVIQVGLEVLIVADIVRTIIVEPTLESVAVLATVVVVRIILSWAIDVEVEGTWPWKMAGRATAPNAADTQDTAPAEDSSIAAPGQAG